MIGDIKGGNGRLTEASKLDVCGIIGTDRHACVDDVGDLHHDRADPLCELLFLCLKRLALCVCVGDELLHRFCLVLFALTHQIADLLGIAVAVGTQLVCSLLCAAVFGIQLDDLIDQGELMVLEFLFDVFFYDIGIFS